MDTNSNILFIMTQYVAFISFRVCVFKSLTPALRHMIFTVQLCCWLFFSEKQTNSCPSRTWRLCHTQNTRSWQASLWEKRNFRSFACYLIIFFLVPPVFSTFMKAFPKSISLTSSSWPCLSVKYMGLSLHSTFEDIPYPALMTDK